MSRVSVFNGFIGQGRTVGHLRQIAAGAKKKSEPMPPMLLVGGSGLGKTRLAKALAQEIGTPCHVIVAGKNVDLLSLAQEAKNWSALDVVLFDEAHSLSPAVQQACYRIIDEGVAPGLDEREGKPPKVKGIMKVPPVTLIFATDQAGQLRRALRKRCRSYVLRPYTLAEMIAICRQIAAKEKILLSPQAHRAIAEASFGCPRVAKYYIADFRLIHASEPDRQYSVADVRAFFQAQGIDELGRTSAQQEYMCRLRDLGPRGGSLTTLAAAMHLDKAFVLSEIEPPLIQNGWVAIRPGGRVLTPAGLAMAQETTEGQDDED